MSSLADPHERLAELHKLFLSHFNNNNLRHAKNLLREIRAESRASHVGLSATPTATKAGRLPFWEAMYERTAEHPLTTDLAIEILREIRAER